MKIVIVGDVGHRSYYHVGDEAMYHAAVDELNRRGVDTFITPATDLGIINDKSNIICTPKMEFSNDSRRNEAYLDTITRAISGDQNRLSLQDPAWQLINHVQSCNGVLIAGGGNLNSLYPWMIFERVSIARMAVAYNKPFVVTGQTIGPILLPRDYELVREIMLSASLIGVREPTSLKIVQEMGVHSLNLSLTFDDASFLEIEPLLLTPECLKIIENKPYILATFSPSSGMSDYHDFVTTISRALTQIHEMTGLRIILIPHMGDISGHRLEGDQIFHQTLVERANGDWLISAPLFKVRDVVAITQNADMVITSRYHPAVFSTGAGVPTLAIGLDIFGNIRLHGVLNNWGLGSFSLPLPLLFTGDFVLATRETWERRSDIRAHLNKFRARIRDRSISWWDTVYAALCGNRDYAFPETIPVPKFVIENQWAAFADAIRDWYNSASSRETYRYLTNTQQELEETRKKLSNILNCRTFRWTAGFRILYSKIRSLI